MQRLRCLRFLRFAWEAFSRFPGLSQLERWAQCREGVVDLCHRRARRSETRACEGIGIMRLGHSENNTVSIVSQHGILVVLGIVLCHGACSSDQGARRVRWTLGVGGYAGDFSRRL